MAPDINTLPGSTRPDGPANTSSQPTSTNTSRRASQVMRPPAVPASATQYPPHQPHIRPGGSMAGGELGGAPLRHPRPLTAAELYLECEKEQEAVVNRLTRELTALRAQSASVASNASHSSTSTSASLLPVDISDPNPAHQMTGPTHPTPSRRHRSSSSVSSRSINTPTTSVSAAASSSNNHSTQANVGSATSSMPHGTVSQASADRAAAAGGGSLSRQPSVSGTSTPARPSLDGIRQPSTTSHILPHRSSVSRDPSQTTISSTHAQPGTPHPSLQALASPARSPNFPIAMQHHSDTTAYRTEMEIVKAENETLRQRVRALERALRSRRRDSSQSQTEMPPHTRDSSESTRAPSLASPLAATAGIGVAAWAAGDGGVGGVAGPRERSESQSTTASSRRGVGSLEDEVRVGESASSVGVGRGS